MGYYTSYQLSMSRDISRKEIVMKEDEIANLIQKIKILRSKDRYGDHPSTWFLEELNQKLNFETLSCFDENCKWYTCSEDMKLASTLFPDVLFEIRGDGEQTGDMWKAYFKDGKMARYQAKFVFPEFNEDDME